MAIIGNGFLGNKAPIPTDPLFADVLLLVHPTGADGNPPTDVKGNVITGFSSGGGQSVISSAQSPFVDKKSIIFNGNNWLRVDNSATTFEIGNSNFTIEAWVYLSDVINFQSIVGKWGSPSGSGNYILGVTSNKLTFDWKTFSGSVSLLTSSSNLSLNTWTYIAVARNGANFYLYINGNLESTAINLGTGTINTGLVLLGNSEVGSPVANNTYISEIRITKAFRSITGVPTMPFPDS